MGDLESRDMKESERRKKEDWNETLREEGERERDRVCGLCERQSFIVSASLSLIVTDDTNAEKH